jgi:hypothetical protein
MNGLMRGCRKGSSLGLTKTAAVGFQKPTAAREIRSQRAAPKRGSRWQGYFDIFFFFDFFVAMAHFLLV